MIVLLGLLACGPSPTAAPSITAAKGDVARPADVAPTPAPPARFDLGAPATPEQIAAWDLDVDPTGAALPPGRGTPAQGATLYAQKCAACHGAKGEGGIIPHAATLIGGAAKDADFATDPKLVRTMGNYWPYATTVYDYLRRAMPQNAPGSLAPDEVYAITAYLLAENGVVGPDFVADKDSLPKVEMPGKFRFVPDDRLETTSFR